MRKYLLLAFMVLAAACDRNDIGTGVAPQLAPTDTAGKTSCVAATPDTTTAIGFLNKHVQVYNYIGEDAVIGESTINSTYFTGKADHHWDRAGDHQLWGVNYYMHEDDGIGPVWCTEDLGSGGAPLSFHSKFVAHYLGTSGSAVITRSSDLLSYKWEDDKVDMYITLIPPTGGEFPCEGDPLQLVDFDYDAGDLTMEVRSGADIWGTHTLDVVWMGKWIEDADLGDRINDLDDWDPTAGNNVIWVEVDDTRAWSGTQSLDANGEDNDAAGMYYTKPGDRFSKWYMTSWHYFDPITNNGTGQSQFKMIAVNPRAYGNRSNVHDGSMNIGGNWTLPKVVSMGGMNWYTRGTNYGTNCTYPCNGPTCGNCLWVDGAPSFNLGNDHRYWKIDSNGATTAMPYKAEEWYRFTFMGEASSDLDVYDGSSAMQWHSPGKTPWSWEVRDIGTRSSLIKSPENTDTTYEQLAWKNQYTHRFAVVDHWQDDLYIQFGTHARVEIGDEACYSDCTQLEIQPPTAWVEDEITVELNYGGFDSDDEVYVFIIDDDGDVHGGYPYIMP